MALFCWNGNVLQILRKDRMTDITFPDIGASRGKFNAPVFSKDERYIAVCEGSKIYIHDAQDSKIITPPEQFKNTVFFVRFDDADRVYYIEGNRIGRWDLTAQKVETLYHMSRAVHGPEWLGVSPDGRYISFCKYRSGSDHLFIFDVQTKECRDLKCSLYHYIWIDQTHIAWTLLGGLKILDVESGKSTTLVRGWKDLYKKTGKEYAALLEKFCGKEDIDIYTYLDLLGCKDGKLYFSLRVRYHYRDNEADLSEKLKKIGHQGVWSVGTDGTNPAFCYVIPDEFVKAIHKGFLSDGSIYWLEPEALHIAGGGSVKRMDAPCAPVIDHRTRNK